MTPSRKIKTLFYRLHQQYHRCFYCSRCMAGADCEITLDHVAPVSLGWLNRGSFDTAQNSVAACIGCNKKKGARMPSAEEEMRLAVLNQGYTDAIADAHYADMLRVSAHSLHLLRMYGISF